MKKTCISFAKVGCFLFLIGFVSGWENHIHPVTIGALALLIVLALRFGVKPKQQF